MKKIAIRIFLMFNLLTFLLLLLLFISNNFFLENFYLRYKEKQVLEVAQKIAKNNSLDIEALGEEKNLIIQVFNKERYNHIFHRMNKHQNFIRKESSMMGHRRRENIDRNHNNMMHFENLSKVPKATTMVDKKDRNIKFIFLAQKLEDDSVLLINSPMFAINEAVNISTKFLFITLILGVILSTILSIVLSKNLSKPIKEIDKKTKEIAKLNFSNELHIGRKDELGSLGKSINTLSNNLKNTIKNLEISNQRLSMEIKKEKEIDAIRREFISNINHELKTPIAIIEGYAEGLLDNINSEDDKNFYCEVIIDECKKMDDLVKKILLGSKYESNFISLKIEKFNLIPLLENLLKKYYLDFEYKKLKIVKLYDSLVEVKADPKEISIAIDNYLSNSINYSREADEIKIKVEEREGYILFSISNSSDEISQEKIIELFEPFNKIDKSRNRKYGGTGLGLSIVKKIIILHKGTYGGTYENGVITFFFHLNKNF